MTALETILLIALASIWIVISITILVATIQNFIYERKREIRAREQSERETEYHLARMKALKNERY